MIDKDKLAEIRELQIRTIGDEPENIAEFVQSRGIEEAGLLEVLMKSSFAMMMAAEGYTGPRVLMASALFGVLFGILIAEERQALAFAEQIEAGGDA